MRLLVVALAAFGLLGLQALLTPSAAQASHRLSTPAIDEIGEFTGTSLFINWNDIAGAADYHWRLTYGGSTEYGSTAGRSWEVVDIPSSYSGAVCMRVTAVGGGVHTDSVPSIRCGTRLAPPPPPPPPRLSTPVIAEIGDFTGTSLFINWNDVTDAGDYHWRLTYGNVTEYGSTGGRSWESVDIRSSYHGAVCIRVIAVGGAGGRADSIPSIRCGTRLAPPPPPPPPRLSTPVIAEIGDFTARNRLVRWDPVPHVGEYHWRLTYNNEHRYGATDDPSYLAILPVDYYGPVCLRVIAVGGAGGRPDSAASIECGTRLAPPAPPSRLATVAVSTNELFVEPALEASWPEVPYATDYHWMVFGPSFVRYGATGGETNATVQLDDSYGAHCIRVIAVAGGNPRDSVPSVSCGVRGSADLAEATQFLRTMGIAEPQIGEFQQAIQGFMTSGIGIGDSLLLVTGNAPDVIARKAEVDSLRANAPAAIPPATAVMFSELSALLETRRIALQQASGEIWDGTTEIYWTDPDRPLLSVRYGERNAQASVQNVHFSHLRDSYTWYWTENGWNVGQVSMALLGQDGQPRWNHYNYQTGVHDLTPRPEPTRTMYEIMQDHSDTSYMSSYPMTITPQYFPNGPIAPDFQNYPEGGSSNCFIDTFGPPVPVTECGVGGIMITLGGAVFGGPDPTDIAIPLMVYIYSQGPPPPTVEGPARHMQNGVPIRPGG